MFSVRTTVMEPPSEVATEAHHIILQCVKIQYTQTYTCRVDELMENGEKEEVEGSTSPTAIHVHVYT